MLKYPSIILDRIFSGRHFFRSKIVLVQRQKSNPSTASIRLHVVTYISGFCRALSWLFIPKRDLIDEEPIVRERTPRNALVCGENNKHQN